MGSNPHYGFTSRSALCKMRLKMMSTAHAGSGLPSVRHPSLFQSYHCEKAHPVCPFRMHKVHVWKAVVRGNVVQFKKWILTLGFKWTCIKKHNIYQCCSQRANARDAYLHRKHIWHQISESARCITRLPKCIKTRLLSQTCCVVELDLCGTLMGISTPLCWKEIMWSVLIVLMMIYVQVTSRFR